MQEIEQLGQRLAGAAMRAMAAADLETALHWLRRARAVHATPAVRTLERIVAGAHAAPPDLPHEAPPAADSAW